MEQFKTKTLMAEEKKMLAKIFCLKIETADDDDCLFREFWGKVRGCKVCKKDVTKKITCEEFKDKLLNLKRKFLKGKYECLVVAISSHGIEQEDEQRDGVNFVIRSSILDKPFQVNELLKIFDDGEIQNKNKIFLMQMCRSRSDINTVTGQGQDSGVLHNPEQDLTGLASQDKNLVPWPKTWKLSQPCIANSIVFLSAPSGFISHTKMYTEAGGGWLFLCMKKALEKLTGQENISIINLFLKVNDEMSKMETVDGAYVGMSSFNHMLTENICIEIRSDSK